MNVRIVVHHDISDHPSDFEAPLGVSTPVRRFVRQVDRLARGYDVVDVGTLISGRLPRRPLLITSDDHYRFAPPFPTRDRRRFGPRSRSGHAGEAFATPRGG